MLIHLKRNWFTPDATFLRMRLNPHDVPDAWLDLLPEGTGLVTEGQVASKEKAPDKRPARSQTDKL